MDFNYTPAENEFRMSLMRVTIEDFIMLPLPPIQAVRLMVREGLLSGAALFLDPWDSLLKGEHLSVLTLLWEALIQYPLPVFLSGSEDWFDAGSPESVCGKNIRGVSSVN